MSRELIEQWYQKIPPLERTQALIIHGNRGYSPNEVLSEVRKGTALGQELQRIIESRQFTEVLDKYSLALARLKERLKAMPPGYRIMVGTKSYTPDQLLREIDQGTEVGRKLLEVELRRVEEVLSKAV